jgi:hypothetical protein
VGRRISGCWLPRTNLTLVQAIRASDPIQFPFAMAAVMLATAARTRAEASETVKAVVVVQNPVGSR